VTRDSFCCGFARPVQLYKAYLFSDPA